VIAGFVALARLFPVVLPADPADGVILDSDWRTLLMALAMITMTAGTLASLWQRDVKRFFAYLGIAQAGTMLVGVVAASDQGTAAVLFALLAHAPGMLGAFAAVAAMAGRTGSFDVEEYGGMHELAPELAWPLLICLLSVAGVPPTAGFVARLGLYAAAVDEGLLWLAAVGVVNGVILLYGIWRLARLLFLASPRAEEGRRANSPFLVVALGLGTVGVFAIALFAGPLLAWLQAAAQAL
jgi:NADH-quinone oxidoreductase subunit N